MHKITKTSIIIYDDYNNVLVVQRGKNNRNTPEIWSIVGKDLKGKENEEKCINKAVDNDLGCSIFNLTPFKEYVINEENNESLLVYSGIIREYIISHKTINKIKWISEREIETHQFSTNEKEILTDFFKSHRK